MTDSGADVAVVILTFCEETNLSAALDSVQGWAREVFVVDSYSTDATVDLALARSGDGVHLVQHRFEDYSRQWNWAINALPVRSAWTLKLDADERVTPEFQQEVARLVANAHPDLNGVYFRRRLFFSGQPLKWGGVKENWDLRLWRTGRATFEDRAVNEHCLVTGKTARVASFVEHRDSKSLTDWIDKHNRYASLEARSILAGNVVGGVEPRLWGSPEQRRMWLKRAFRRVPLRSTLYFLYCFLLRLGILDGRAGFRHALLKTMWFYWIDLKIDEHRQRGVVPEVNWPERGKPHPTVASSVLQREADERWARFVECLGSAAGGTQERPA